MAALRNCSISMINVSYNLMISMPLRYYVNWTMLSTIRLYIEHYYSNNYLNLSQNQTNFLVKTRTKIKRVFLFNLVVTTPYNVRISTNNFVSPITNNCRCGLVFITFWVKVPPRSIDLQMLRNKDTILFYCQAIRTVDLGMYNFLPRLLKNLKNL